MKIQKMKFAAIALAMSCSMSSYAQSEHDVSTQYQQSNEVYESQYLNAQGFLTTVMIREAILDGAKSALKGGVKDFISGLLFGGSSPGPQIVRLHEEDLQKIEDLVSGVVITDAVYDAKSQLAAFGNTFDYYQDSLSGGNFDASILTSLLQYVNSLREHRAYDPNYNSNAYALTTSYSLMTTLNLAVLTERHVKGYISASFVRSQADAMANKLSQLGNLVNTKAASMGGVRTFGSDCWGGRFSTELSAHSTQDKSDDNQVMAPVDCLVTASFPGKPSKTWNGSQIGIFEAEELAYEYLNQMRAEYRSEIKGADFDSVVAKLRNL